MSIVLGADPPKLIVILVPGSTYWTALESVQAWTVALDLHFTGSREPVVWPATITGNRAAWRKSAAQVAEVIGSGNRYADLRYTEPGSDPTIWYWGAIQVATR